MKIAVVHDYFTQLGGAERLVGEIYRMLPDPTLFATVAFANCVPNQLTDVKIHTSWLQKLPSIEKYYRLYFLLYPFGVRALNLSEYDLVVSSSSGYAKGVQVGRNAVHVCYCHTPMRWVWSFDTYSQRESYALSQRAVLAVLLRGLKAWDDEAARQPDHFVANSKVVAERIQRAYGRSAEIIHPPIQVDRFRPSAEREDFYLVVSRLVSYKRIDIAVRACSERGKQLIVAGEGPDRKALEMIAGPSVRFVGRVSDAEVEYLGSRCRALLFPGEEDFGMAPLEIAAAGRPTIAYRAGGALETIVENDTGVFFDHQTPEALGDAIEQFERESWSPSILRRHAERFSVAVFQDRFRSFLSRIGAPVGETTSHELDHTVAAIVGARA
jgi:glycosyltransferase involved in cell wall biosynthesis